ncbi:unnamed protein product [Amoebophrya sp. A25]|nr:unnamed protein product [Amoebophrya sp. A25]|eukprot:GSA25T00014478001.1
MDPPSIDTPTLSGPTSIFLQWNITADTMRGISPKGFAVYRDEGHLNSTPVDFANLRAIDLAGSLEDGVTVPDPACTAQAFDGACYPELPSWDTRSCVHKPVYDVAHSRNCTITGLEPNTYYRFRIAAINVLGRGPVSNDVVLKTGSVGNVFNTIPQFEAAESGMRTMFTAGMPLTDRTNETSPSVTFGWTQPPQEDGDFIFNYKALLTYVPDTSNPLPDDPTASTFLYAANGTLENPLPLSVRSLTIRASDSPEAEAFLKPRRQYTFQLLAESELGLSEPTVSSDAGYLVAKPLPVLSFRQDVSKGFQGAVVHVAWDSIIDLSYAATASTYVTNYTETAPPGWTPPTRMLMGNMDDGRIDDMDLKKGLAGGPAFIGAEVARQRTSYSKHSSSVDANIISIKDEDQEYRTLLASGKRDLLSAAYFEDQIGTASSSAAMLRQGVELDTEQAPEPAGDGTDNDPNAPRVWAVRDEASGVYVEVDKPGATIRVATDEVNKQKQKLVELEEEQEQAKAAIVIGDEDDTITSSTTSPSKIGSGPASSDVLDASAGPVSSDVHDLDSSVSSKDISMSPFTPPHLRFLSANASNGTSGSGTSATQILAICIGEDPANTTIMNCTTTTTPPPTSSTTTTTPPLDIYFSSETGGDYFRNTFYEIWAREVFNDGTLYRTTSEGVTGDFILRYKEPILVGSTTSIMTNSDNPGALMELKIRTSNNNGASEFSKPVMIYSGELCPPVQNLKLLEEDPEFVTVNWDPPVSTGYAPFVLHYEAVFDSVDPSTLFAANSGGNSTSSSSSSATSYSTGTAATMTSASSYRIGTTEIVTGQGIPRSANAVVELRDNFNLYWDINKAALRALNSPKMWYTITPVTHVGKGVPVTVLGEVVL